MNEVNGVIIWQVVVGAIMLAVMVGGVSAYYIKLAIKKRKAKKD